MIVGDLATFAVESEITAAVPEMSQRALGFFVIHIQGRAFGVRRPDASMLGASFNEVRSRLEGRGKHSIPELTDIDGRAIAEAYLDALYRETSRADFFGQSPGRFTEALKTSATIWAPDGDEAFDDGSHILQFDIANRVRLIAFVNTTSPGDVASTLREEWLDATVFYDALSRWSEWFAAEWARRLEQGTAPA